MKKKTGISPVSKAETAWKIFLPKFNSVVKAKDYNLVKEMSVQKISCDSKESYEAEERGETDLRNVCINHWKTTKKEFAGDLDWKDLQTLLLRYFQRIESDAGETSRYITYAKKYNDCSEDDLFARFVFVNGSWFLQAFKHGECGD